MSYKKLRRPAALLLVLSVSIAMSLSNTASAAGGTGLRVSPVRTDLTIAPGRSQTVTITVTNVTAERGDYQAIITDFTARGDETDQPALILDPNRSNPKNGLKKYVAKVPNFSLEPGQQKSIPVTINIPADAPGGGYFGAVRFAPAGSEDPGRNVYIAGSIAPLLLVTVPGDITSQVSLASFDVRKDDNAKSLFTSSKDIDAVVRFRNQGNIQEQPFGKIALKDRSGKTLAEYEINDSTPRGNVLPDSVRKFTVPLDKVGSFGIFKLEGNFGYGTKGQLLSASTTFYVIPTALILGFLGVVALIVFLIFGLPKLVRGYNERILRQAGRRR